MKWIGSKPGGQHHGTVQISEGTLNIEKGVITSGTFTIDLRTIKDLDLEPGTWNDKLVGHLKSEDFFYIEKYPVATFKRVENLIAMPPANWSNLPGFEEMKKGKPQYGGVSKITDPKFNPDTFSEKFFRKGKSGGWKEEMSTEIQDLFWNYHGHMMESLGYEHHKVSVRQNTLLDYKAMKLLGLPCELKGSEKFSVLIEASKLADPGNDGIKRYLIHLLKGFEAVTKTGDPRWEFRLLIG